jgi:hypothetical protein
MYNLTNALTNAFDNSPRIHALLRVYASMTPCIEVARIPLFRNPDMIEGRDLNALADYIGVERGRTDEETRANFRAAQTTGNYRSGTAGVMYQAANFYPAFSQQVEGFGTVYLIHRRYKGFDAPTPSTAAGVTRVRITDHCGSFFTGMNQQSVLTYAKADGATRYKITDFSRQISGLYSTNGIKFAEPTDTGRIADILIDRAPIERMTMAGVQVTAPVLGGYGFNFMSPQGEFFKIGYGSETFAPAVGCGGFSSVQA